MRKPGSQPHLTGSTAVCAAACLFALGFPIFDRAAYAGDASNEEATIAPVVLATDPPATPQTPEAGQVPPMLTQSYAADNSVCPPDPAEKPRLCGLIAPSDASFGDFISPISNPVFFEDPRTLTEAKFIFLNHQLPSSVGGNNIQLYALQLRVALTDRLSIIATKDGYIVSENGVEGDGWANLSAGLKYNLYKDAAAQQILSVGATFQIPTGTPAALQGNGDGEFDLFATGGVQIGQYWHWISASGFRLASDPNDQTDSWYWSNHIDRKLTSWGLYGLYEVNWYHWLRSGDNDVPIDGLDLLNLGEKGVAGHNVVTNAVGLKWSPSINQEIGIAFEFPLTANRDLMADRINFNWILRY
ncbi:MAG TPA: hypothetical protein VEI07_18955 [Planctomycetaceae bacterium]|nr:hypothetical protein [Planctomycetaceae bacterium]